MRIAVLGYSGSGKSTLAKYLSQKFAIPVLYLDTVEFEAGWKTRNREEAVAIVAEFMKKSDWVIDGNYSGFLQEERLQQADHIIFLSFPRVSCLFRAYKRFRNFKDITRESMAQGCKEKLDFEFICWILFEGRTKQRRQHYKNIVSRYSSKTVVIKNQHQLDRFMLTLFRGDDRAQ